MKFAYKIIFGMLLVHSASTKAASTGHKSNSINGEPKYSFSYAVNDETTGDKKSHFETRDGDLTVGEYSLVQPDGGIRTVKYTVDGDSGFKANVRTSFNNKNFNAYQETSEPSTTSTTTTTQVSQDEDCDPRFKQGCPYTEGMNPSTCTRHAQCPFKHYCCTNTVQKYDFLRGSCLSIYDVRCN